ncbi:MAG: gluconate 2-dehydrogenase subunit 3 family protein [Bacteroidota bacterium]
MKRRTALSNLSLIAGGSTLLPQLMLSGCETKEHPYALFQIGDTELLNDIAETIIPETPDSPGAKTANVGDFIQSYVTNCFSPADQKAFTDGFVSLKTEIDSKFGKDFTGLSIDEKTEVIRDQENQRVAYQKQAKPGDPPHFYQQLKSTILFGYFTSEPGATQALRYVPVPGGQQGIIPYNGEKAWAL